MLAHPLIRLALAPVLLVQGLVVRARARALPEAAGSRAGVCGAGPGLRLLIVGDSSAAGVGVSDQREALAGQLVTRLAARHRVEWRLVAQSGATVADATGWVEASDGWPADVVLVVLGVNDVTRMTGLRVWEDRVRGLCAVLRRRHGAGRVIWSGVPQMVAFPLLPRPLRDVLGAVAQRNDMVLARLAAGAVPGLEHVRLDLPHEPHLMARDGFHPGVEGYRLWARLLAARIAGDGPQVG